MTDSTNSRRGVSGKVVAVAWLVTVLVGFLGVGGWLGWQWSQDGVAWLAAGRSHVSGHFGTWGGSVLTDASLPASL